jgi:hypothetical protein
MEMKKVSKKALKVLLNDSLREAIGRLELPQPTKKLDKLISKSSKKLAIEFAGILKKQIKKERPSEKSATYVEDVLKGKKLKTSKKDKTKKVISVA